MVHNPLLPQLITCFSVVTLCVANLGEAADETSSISCIPLPPGILQNVNAISNRGGIVELNNGSLMLAEGQVLPHFHRWRSDLGRRATAQLCHRSRRVDTAEVRRIGHLRIQGRDPLLCLLHG